VSEPTWSDVIQAAMNNPGVPREAITLIFSDSAPDGNSASAACVDQVNGSE
jgi:hypothetical protein